MRHSGNIAGTSPAGEHEERPVLPAGGVRRTTRLAALPLRHAARTAAAATRLSTNTDSREPVFIVRAGSLGDWYPSECERHRGRDHREQHGSQRERAGSSAQQLEPHPV